jgi:hypothetical protein
MRLTKAVYIFYFFKDRLVLKAFLLDTRKIERYRGHRGPFQADQSRKIAHYYLVKTLEVLAAASTRLARNKLHRIIIKSCQSFNERVRSAAVAIVATKSNVQIIEFALSLLYREKVEQCLCRVFVGAIASIDDQGHLETARARLAAPMLQGDG